MCESDALFPNDFGSGLLVMHAYIQLVDGARHCQLRRNGVKSGVVAFDRSTGIVVTVTLWRISLLCCEHHNELVSVYSAKIKSWHFSIGGSAQPCGIFN